MEFWRILAHRHWFTLRILGEEIRLCARCSGYVLGLFILFVIGGWILPAFGSLNLPLQVLLCLIMASPLMLDWLTQKWGVRESNNGMRMLTGGILGAVVPLYVSIDAPLMTKRYLFLYSALSILLLGYFGEISYKLLRTQ